MAPTWGCEIFAGGDAGKKGGYVAKYYLNGSFLEQSNDGNYTVTGGGSYTAQAYDTVSTCISVNASDAIFLNLTAVQKASGVNVSLYPNPVASVVTIETSLSSGLAYELTDLSGVVVCTGTIEGNGTINMEPMKSGVYTLTINNEKDQLGSYKLVK